MVTATETPAATAPAPLTSSPGLVSVPPASAASSFATRNGTAFDFGRGRRPARFELGSTRPVAGL